MDTGLDEKLNKRLQKESPMIGEDLACEVTQETGPDTMERSQTKPVFGLQVQDLERRANSLRHNEAEFDTHAKSGDSQMAAAPSPWEMQHEKVSPLPSSQTDVVNGTTVSLWEH